MDTGLLILRVVVGLFFLGHGTQKLFAWFGGFGLEGTGGYFESLGYRPGRVHAVLAGVSETAAGVLLTLGFLTPLGCAAVIGVMLNAMISVHWHQGVWVQEGGIEYPMVLAAIAAAVAFVGPGDASVDGALNWNLAGVTWGLGAVLIGLFAGMMVNAVREPAAEADPGLTEERSDERSEVRAAASVDTPTGARSRG